MVCIPSGGRGDGCGSAIIRLVVCCWVLCGFAVASRGDPVTVTNLVTDDQTANPAQITDPFLKNAWGISHSPGSPFWVSDNASGVATLYQVNPLTNATTKVNLGAPPSGGIVIPPPGAGTPTGQVFNSAGASAFDANTFLFVSEDGIVSGWRNSLGSTAEILQTGLATNVYKGTTLDTTGGHSYLLSANFRAGTIDVLKGDTGATDLAGRFTDPNTPAGYAPFNIQTLGSRIYVTYALQDAAKHDDVAGAGHGFVAAFDLQGSFLGRIGSTGALNSPWGLAIAPSSFGSFAGDLLVGNFGDGTVNVFNPDPATTAFLGPLVGGNGLPIAIDGLWGLIPGNDGNGGSSQEIYFSAGPNDEAHGLFGVLSVPEPSSVVVLAGGVVAMRSRRRTKVRYRLRRRVAPQLSGV
jgi:uncharacterized protein (TIGR03118 family)